MRLSRRGFLRLGSAGALAGAWLALSGRKALSGPPPADELQARRAAFAVGAHLGRVTLARTALQLRPNPDSRELGWKFKDDVVEVLREVIGRGRQPQNHVWMETADGFLYAPDIQPMVYQPNEAVEGIPEGRMWVEVSVPFLEGRAQPAPVAPVRDRLYYASIYPVSDVFRDADGHAWYHLDEHFYTSTYALAEGLRPIQPDEIAPISPEVEDKKVVVDLTRQSLSAFENGVEVFHARIASGARITQEGQERWATPPGSHRVQKKWVGVRMSAGDAVTGYNLPGVGWATVFVSTSGIAIHSTYWHNDYGIPKSHGCVNARPADAKWIFAWTLPEVPLPEGEAQPQLPGGTEVIVRE